jgi:hypothetical protein
MPARGWIISVIAVVIALSLSDARGQAPSAPAPVYKVGDEWRYTNGRVLRVVAIENDMVVTTETPNVRCPDCRYFRDVQFTTRSILDKDGNSRQMNETGLQTRVFPMEVGKSWVSNVTSFSPNSNRWFPYTNTFKVEGYKEVKTKAGTFKAFEISWRQENKGPGSSWWGNSAFWYSPEVRGVVKRETYATGWGENWELESYALKD